METVAKASVVLLGIVGSAFCGGGTVQDSLGVPLSRITVTRVSDGASTLTDAEGKWFLASTGVSARSPLAPDGSGSGLLAHRGGLRIRFAGDRRVDGRSVWSGGGLPAEDERIQAGRTAAGTDSVVAAGPGWRTARSLVDNGSDKNRIVLEMAGSRGMALARGGYDSVGSLSQANNRPHVVRVAGFWIDSLEVTQALFDSLMGYNPSFHQNCRNCPVERVSWFDAVRFCNARSRKEGLPEAYDLSSSDSMAWTWNPGSPGFRLPTDTEWEYAGRAGNASDWYWGPDLTVGTISKYAWYEANAGDTTHPVGRLLPNDLGLHDMSGNVAEWTYDWFMDYGSDSLVFPKGPTTVQEWKGTRGGTIQAQGTGIIVTQHAPSIPTTRWFTIGFRCARGVMP